MQRGVSYLNDRVLTKTVARVCLGTLIVLYFFMSFYGFVSRIRLILFSERNRESLKCGWCVTYSKLFTGLSFFETLVSQLIFLFQTIVLNRCYRLHPYLALCLLGY